ncbi:MAG: type transport system ATP-binding protein [Actinomycetota bacterium]|nr:type transport system ATP-binding protein [Actinomycetota bacterium]
MLMSQVSKRYRVRGPWILRELDLELEPGRLVRIEGGNGSGKSTLLRIAAGAGRPQAGRITDRPETSYVPQRIPERIAFDPLDYLVHLGLIRGMSAGDARDRAALWLRHFQVSPAVGVPVKELSRGTVQKVMVCQALMSDGPFVVLDEAWSGLDDETQDLLDAEVLARVATGSTVLFVDHDPLRLIGRPMDCWLLEAGSLLPLEPVRFLDDPDAGRAGDRTAQTPTGSRAAATAGPREVVIRVSGPRSHEAGALVAGLGLRTGDAGGTGGTGGTAGAGGVLEIVAPRVDSDTVLGRLLALGEGIHIEELRPVAPPAVGGPSTGRIPIVAHADRIPAAAAGTARTRRATTERGTS